eukprot:624356-Pleurochrysis_carterae.AAC.3
MHAARSIAEARRSACACSTQLRTDLHIDAARVTTDLLSSSKLSSANEADAALESEAAACAAAICEGCFGVDGDAARGGNDDGAGAAAASGSECRHGGLRSTADADTNILRCAFCLPKGDSARGGTAAGAGAQLLAPCCGGHASASSSTTHASGGACAACGALQA